jgi:hypothetical protein
VQITITLPVDAAEELEGLDNRQLHGLLMDALAEFVAHRGPTPEEYVNRRYPNTPNYAWLDREKKARSVRWRNHVAEQIRRMVDVGIDWTVITTAEEIKKRYGND